MKKSLYPRLAWQGIKKNGKIYFPYLAACMAMVAVFYVLGFLSHDKIVRDMNGGQQMQAVLSGNFCYGLFCYDFSVLYQLLPDEAAKERAGTLSYAGYGQKEPGRGIDLGKSDESRNFFAGRAVQRNPFF